MIREQVFCKVTKDAKGNIESLESLGKHYLPEMDNHVDKTIRPPTGRPFSLRFPTELREETLKDGWVGPFSKYEMAAFYFEEIKKRFPNRINEVRPRIQI